MGYLRKSSFPEFSKAIISTWFWVPSESIAAVVPEAYFGGSSAGNWQEQGVLPLLTFGSRNILDSVGQPQALSNIGILCGGGSPYPLSAMLQSGFFSEDQEAPRFLMAGTGFPANTSTYITPDAWQHVLLSFDISGGWSYTGDPPEPGPLASSSFFSWSLNNVSKNNKSIGPSGDNGVLGDVTKIIWQFVGNVPSGTTVFPGVTIPSGPVAIATDYTPSGQRIRMAKLQMWTGRYLDAGALENRRLFIDATGRPVDKSMAWAALGRPAICFDKQDDWINGRNLGTAGAFTRTGTISKSSVGAGL